MFTHSTDVFINSIRPTLGCADCSLSDYLTDHYNTGSSATAANIATAAMVVTAEKPTITVPTPPPPTPPSPKPGSVGVSNLNYCGSNWAAANSKCATPCPRGSDEECSNSEICFADCTGCAPRGGGSGPCGRGNTGNGICERSDHCCSEYGWCGKGPKYCSGAATVLGGGGGTPCGWGKIGNGICEGVGFCCSQYGWCGTGAEFCSNASDPLPEEIEVVTTAATPAAIAMSNAMFQLSALDRDVEWLASHNSRRRSWHKDNSVTYVPLRWSAALAVESLVFAQHLADTDQFYHDPNRGPYGENLAWNSGDGERRTVDGIVSGWVEDEVGMDYPDNGHLTQVLWRASTWVGCADAQNGDRFVQVCRYAVPGNCNMDKYATWLEPMLQDASPCGNACHPDDGGCSAETATSAAETVTSATGAAVVPDGSYNSGVPETTKLGAAAAVESVLNSKRDAIDNKILLYQSPTLEWEPSSVYRYRDLAAALRVMYEEGVANKYFYVGDDSSNGHIYGLVNIAAFLAQSMKETVKYNACDENSWDMVGGGYPLSNACGQLGQSYQDYKCAEHEAHMECPVRKDMAVTATTNAKWWGAPAPLFCGPKSSYPETGYWDPYASCSNSECDEYEGQKGGDFVTSPPSPNSSSRTDVEGCCWWGRGVIQTTGVCNFGKLNFYLGARAAEEGRESRYPDIDFCETPNAICGNKERGELKWIAGMFYWIESLQSYNSGGWDYITELHKFVDDGMFGSTFINAVSGIVNRGCHNPPCASGGVDGMSERSSNFVKVLSELELM